MRLHKSGIVRGPRRKEAHGGHVPFEVALVVAALAAQHARVLPIRRHRMREFLAASTQ